MTRRSLAFVAAILALSPALVQARTWKNQAGKEIEGEMLTADATTVTLRMATGQDVKFKLELLSNEDQEYVREQVRVKAAFGEEEGSSSSTKPKKREEKKPTIESRVWTDNDGRKVNARFLNVQAGMVTLQMGTSKTLRVPLANFSEADKQYVVEIMESRGEKLDVPPASAIAQAAPQNNNNTGLPGALRPTAPNPPRNAGGFLETKSLDNYIGLELDDGTVVTKAQIDALPPSERDRLLSFSNFPEGSRRSMFDGAMKSVAREAERKQREELARVENEQRQELARVQREQAEAERRLRETEQAEQRRLQQEQAARQAPVVAYTPPPTPGMPNISPPNIPSPPSIPSPSMPSFSSMQVAICSNCDKEVPANISTGQRCPHCGVKFDYDETKGEKPTSSWSSSGGSTRIPVRGIIFVVMLVLGFFGWLGRKMSGEE